MADRMGGPGERTRGADATGRSIPGSASQLKTIAKYELMNYIRTRRFYVLLTITLIMSGLLTAVVALYQPAGFLSSPLGFYSSWWGMAATYILILSGIFFGGDAISGEFQNKTGYFLVVNPVKRSTIYAGKWVAAFIASLAIFSAFVAVTVANGAYYFGLDVPYQFGLSLAFSVLYLMSILGVTFFFSAIFKSASISILVTAILFLFAFSLTQTLVSNLAQMEPWFLITYGAEVIGNVLKDPYPTHIVTVQLGRVTFTTYNAPILNGVAIMAAYFVICAALGLVIFERRDFS
ncbi:MAG: ABC transporter permease [Candidatus Methanosuratincola sp.]|jgi:ABC-2 type transport system permease protein|nr:ABC transporter permease [Candidatus Methanosuratincola sp.]